MGLRLLTREGSHGGSSGEKKTSQVRSENPSSIEYQCGRGEGRGNGKQVVLHLGGVTPGVDG